MKLSEQVRELVRSSGHSRNAICRGTGLDKGKLSHFMAGHCGLGLKSLDVLCEFLDAELVRRRPGGGRRRKKRP